MGNREKLLDGAIRCLSEKGYARTTARDIAAAAGVSLAAIGYHFGSKEALLNAALIQATEEWGKEMERALAADADPDTEPMARFEAAWARVTETFTTHRPLWVATFEIFAQAERAPEVRQFLADAFRQGRLGLAELFLNIDSADDERLGAAVGSFYQALLTGVLAQWLIDPEHAPSGRDLANALRTIVTAPGPAGQSTPSGPESSGPEER